MVTIRNFNNFASGLDEDLGTIVIFTCRVYHFISYVLVENLLNFISKANNICTHNYICLVVCLGMRNIQSFLVKNWKERGVLILRI